MRKHRALLLASLVGVLALSVSLLFALRQNPAVSTSAPASAEQPPQLVGRTLFEEQGCMRCHSIAGRGSPRNPLDGVGSRLGRQALRDWVTGQGEAQQELGPKVVEVKQRYAQLPAPQLEALVSYLAGLTAE